MSKRQATPTERQRKPRQRCFAILSAREWRETASSCCEAETATAARKEHRKAAAQSPGNTVLVEVIEALCSTATQTIKVTEAGSDE